MQVKEWVHKPHTKPRVSPKFEPQDGGLLLLVLNKLPVPVTGA